MSAVRVPAQEAVEEIVRLACQAPSIHNSQPWRWEQRGLELRLYADTSRRLPATDPQGRDLLLSCGAALHHLQVAAAGLGWTPRVTRLPIRRHDGLLAVVHLRTGHRSTLEQAARLQALQDRRTDRRPVSSSPVTTERLNRLCATGTSWGAQVLPVLSDRQRRSLEQLDQQAAETQHTDHRYLDELQLWAGRKNGDDGIPAANLLEEDPHLAGSGSSAMMRAFPRGALARAEAGSAEERPAPGAMLLVCTRTDDDVSRLRAGEATSAVWLQAVAGGLVVVPLSQVLEVEETRQALQVDLLRDLAVPQILLRVGWAPADRRPLPATPRRPLDEVLTVRWPLG